MIIDVQYRTVGTKSAPFWEAIKEFPTSCDEIGWKAVGNIAKLLAVFRDKNWPVLYPHVSPKQVFDKGRLSDKVPAIMLSEGHHARGISLSRIAELTATNPATDHGLWRPQGRHRGWARRRSRAD